MTTIAANTTRPDNTFRLHEAIRPRRYLARLDVYVDERRFEGEIEVDLEVGEAISQLRLHAISLDASAVEVAGRPAAGWELEEASETLRIDLDGELVAGRHNLRIVYRAPFSSDMFGLYWAGDVAITQCESAYARRVFPCFDEPAYKAPWKLSISAESRYTVLSNGVIEGEEDAGDGRKLVSFAETRPLASYLIAIAAGSIKGSEPLMLGETEIRTWGAGEQASLSAFAQEIGHFSLQQEAEYFDVPYQFGKLDQLAVKQFQFGAMENAGLVIYNESDLFIDPEKTPLSGRKRVAEVIAHENAHQWFGNYVTMSWWDDLWLNESFATWLALKILDEWQPDWKVWEESEMFRRGALDIDALDCTHPIRAEIKSVQESDERFRQITYYKGGAVLQMLEAYLGADAFRAGMRLYMRRHADGNAAARDLWDALGEASGQPVREIAEEWVDRPGYPIVDVSLEERKLKLSQRRFNLHRVSTEAPWSIPMVISFKDTHGAKEVRVLFRQSKTEVELGAQGDIAYLCANARSSGFYRVAYSEELNQKIQANFDSLAPVDRVAYLSDRWALALSGVAPLRPFLETVAGLGDEQEEAVLAVAAGGLSNLSNRVLEGEDREALKRFVEDLFGPAFQQAGWDPVPDEEEPSRIRRSELLRLVGSLARSEQVVEEAGRRLDRYLSGDEAAVDPNLIDTVTTIACRGGDADRFQSIVKAGKERMDPQGRRRFRTALAAFEDPTIHAQALDMTLSEAISGPDLFRFFNVALSNPVTRQSAWDFYKGNWPQLSEKTGGATMLGYLVEFIQPVGGAYADDVRQFFTANPVPKASQAVIQTLEVLEIDKAFAPKAREEVRAWLKERK